MSTATTSKVPSVEELRIARVYAEAVWEIAGRDGTQAELLEEFDSLVTEVLDRQPDLELFFGLSSISSEQRVELIEKIFRGRASELTYHFMLTLNQHERLGLLRAVAFSLRELWEESQGKTAVLVRSAVPLQEAQLGEIESLLTSELKIKPEMKTEVDPRLLGGLWLRVGDRVYDRSVRSNLNRLRETILTRSSHEIQSGRDIVDHSEGN